MSKKDPVFEVDDRIPDERLRFFRYHESASMDCFAFKGKNVDIANLSWAKMVELEAMLENTMKECRQEIWREAKPHVGSQLLEVESCFLDCLAKGTQLLPEFVRATGCRNKCYDEHE